MIRVKVDGLAGSDRQKLARVAQVAYEIHQATGLTVDVVAGASAQNVDVSLAAGKFGRPGLTLTSHVPTVPAPSGESAADAP